MSQKMRRKEKSEQKMRKMRTGMRTTTMARKEKRRKNTPPQMVSWRKRSKGTKYS